MLGVGGRALLYYLPLAIADRRGFFKEQGIEIALRPGNALAWWIEAVTRTDWSFLALAYIMYWIGTNAI